VSSQQQRDKAARIGELLARLYPAPAIPLQHGDPFTLLCAVVLSAQTTDKKVNQVTPALFAAAGTPEQMAQLPVPTIHSLIRQLGLAPQKAKALQGLSQLLVERHASRLGMLQLNAFSGRVQLGVVGLRGAFDALCL